MEDKPTTEKHRHPQAQNSAKIAFGLPKIQIRKAIQIYFLIPAQRGVQNRQENQVESDPEQHEDYIQPQQRQKIRLFSLRIQIGLRCQFATWKLTQNIIQK